jgi:hypothetical protein
VEAIEDLFDGMLWNDHPKREHFGIREQMSGAEAKE